MFMSITKNYKIYTFKQISHKIAVQLCLFICNLRIVYWLSAFL